MLAAKTGSLIVTPAMDRMQMYHVPTVHRVQYNTEERMHNAGRNDDKYVPVREVCPKAPEQLPPAAKFFLLNAKPPCLIMGRTGRGKEYGGILTLELL